MANPEALAIEMKTSWVDAATVPDPDSYVTIEAEAREAGMARQVIRATYRLRLGSMATEGQRATRLLWQRS